MTGSALSRKSAPALIDGEFRFTARNFERIASFMKQESGIALTEVKATLVYSRLAKRIRKLGLESFDAYCAFVETPEGEAERGEMLAALTTNVTRFFREPHHFDHFRSRMAPRLAETARAGGRVRLWSAACSSGEEPYSLALSLLDLFPDAGRYDVRILATDIDPNIVARARAGVYRSDAVAPIAKATRDRWMVGNSANDTWSVGPEARALISFKELNLIGTWPMRGQFDVIFCRNVVIYFEEATQSALWERFKSLLTPAGRLYIGHSERIDINGYESDGLTIYKLQGRR